MATTSIPLTSAGAAGLPFRAKWVVIVLAVTWAALVVICSLGLDVRMHINSGELVGWASVAHVETSFRNDVSSTHLEDWFAVEGISDPRQGA